MENLLATLAIWALPVIFAITLHEAAHGYVARHFGDPTAWRMGRVSLNPLRHIDPVGTLLVPALFLLTSKALTGSGMLFGWAKPVPVDFGRLRNPKKDMFWVAVAGPAANLFMALVWALLLKLGLLFDVPYLVATGAAGIRINAALMLLNLLPIPPLDGGRIAVSLLPYRQAVMVARLEPYGFVILLALLFFHVLDYVLGPLMAGFILLLKLIFSI